MKLLETDHVSDMSKHVDGVSDIHENRSDSADIHITARSVKTADSNDFDMITTLTFDLYDFKKIY